MKKSVDINVRVDVKMKGRMLEIAEEEKRDLSDVARFAFELYVADRERRKLQQQPELRLYANS